MCFVLFCFSNNKYVICLLSDHQVHAGISSPLSRLLIGKKMKTKRKERRKKKRKQETRTASSASVFALIYLHKIKTFVEFKFIKDIYRGICIFRIDLLALFAF